MITIYCKKLESTLDYNLCEMHIYPILHGRIIMYEIAYTNYFLENVLYTMFL